MDILNVVPDLTEVARHTQGRCSGTDSAGVSLDLKVGDSIKTQVSFFSVCHSRETYRSRGLSLQTSRQ
jgi:hypothetical protein